MLCTDAMPKAVVTDTAFHWYGDRHPNVPWEKSVIYETHVRGMTKEQPDEPCKAWSHRPQAPQENPGANVRA